MRGRAAIPDLQGLDEVPYLDNETLLELNDLPRHLIILGGGYVAVEYGQVFRRFGSMVTIIQDGGQILNREAPDVAEAVQGVLENEGVRFLLNATATTSLFTSNTKEGHGKSKALIC